MTVANGQGAMYKLVHDRTNAILSIRQMTGELIEALKLSGEGDDGQLEIALSVLEKRRETIGQVAMLGKRIDFLAQSGYEPEEEERALIEREKPTVEALLQSIRELEDQAAAIMTAAQKELIANLREIKDGQKSLQAYAGPQDVQEGSQLDTRR